MNLQEIRLFRPDWGIDFCHANTFLTPIHPSLIPVYEQTNDVSELTKYSRPVSMPSMLQFTKYSQLF